MGILMIKISNLILESSDQNTLGIKLGTDG